MPLMRPSVARTVGAFCLIAEVIGLAGIPSTPSKVAMTLLFLSLPGLCGVLAGIALWQSRIRASALFYIIIHSLVILMSIRLITRFMSL